MDDQVSGGTNGYLVSYVARQDELTIVPANFNLGLLTKGLFSRSRVGTHPLSTDVKVMALHVAKELMSCRLFQERDTCSTIMSANVDIQQHSSSYNGYNIGVCDALGEIGQ